MHHEGSSPGPGRAWGGAFIAFKLAKVLGNSHTHESGLALINCIVADHSLPALAGRGLMSHAYEDSVLCSIHHEGEWPRTLFYATCRRMVNP